MTITTALSALRAAHARLVAPITDALSARSTEPRIDATTLRAMLEKDSTCTIH